MLNKIVWKVVLGCNLKNNRMISVHFQGKPFNITAIQVYVPTTNTQEAEAEQFCEDLQDLLELMPRKVFFFFSIIRDCNAKVGSQEIPGETSKLDLGVHSEAEQRLTEFCQENTLVIANTLLKQHKRRFCTWTSPNDQHWKWTDYILSSQRWRIFIQSAKTRPRDDCAHCWPCLLHQWYCWSCMLCQLSAVHTVCTICWTQGR